MVPFLALPAVIMTPQDAIKGKTANISVGGLDLICFPEVSEIGDEFQITLKSYEGNEMRVTCEKVWSDRIVDDETIYHGIGTGLPKYPPATRTL